MTVVVVTASKSSSLSLIIRSNGSAASPTASGNVVAITTGGGLLPIRFTGRYVWRVRASGARRILATGSSTDETTLSR